METKEQLVKEVKSWIHIDNQLTELKKKIRELNKDKKIITSNLMNVMKENEIEVFDIKGGSLVYKQNKVKKTLTSKNLLNILKNYYSNDANTAEKLLQYVMDNREEEIKESIKRKIDKQ